MNHCGSFLRKMAIFAAVASLILNGIMLSSTLYPIKKSRTEYMETEERHNIIHQEYSSYNDDCESCEELDEWKESLNQQTWNAWGSIGMDFLWAILVCCVLYGLGDAVEYMVGVYIHVSQLDKCIDDELKRKTKEEEKSEGGAPAIRTSSSLRCEEGSSMWQLNNSESKAVVCTRCGTTQRAEREYCCECGAKMIKD